MPRYYFNFSDGSRWFTDDAGEEFGELADARRHAIRQVRNLKAAMCAPGIQDLSGWTMRVIDGDGRAVFEVGFDLKPDRVAE